MSSERRIIGAVMVALTIAGGVTASAGWCEKSADPYLEPINVPIKTIVAPSASASAGANGHPGQVAFNPAQPSPGTYAPATPSFQPPPPITKDLQRPYHGALRTFIKNSNPWLNATQIDLFAESIMQASLDQQVDFRLIAGVIAVESSFRTNAVSTSGALGMGQLKVETAQWLGIANPLDPLDNISGTTKYLSFLTKRYNYDLDRAIAAYFQGQGSVDRQGVSDVGKSYLYKISTVLGQFETLASNGATPQPRG